MNDKLNTLIGGVTVTARFRNDNTAEDVTVHALTIRNLRKFADLMAATDEAGQIELFTGKPAAWVDRLTMDSAVEILEAGQKLNEDFFASWAARQKGLGERLASRMK